MKKTSKIKSKNVINKAIKNDTSKIKRILVILRRVIMEAKTLEREKYEDSGERKKGRWNHGKKKSGALSELI